MRYGSRFPLIALAASIAASVGASQAADHRDGPLFGTGGFPSQMDINDVYIFQSPQTRANTVMILTVSPMSGFAVPAGFLPKARYDFVLDTNGDAVEDQVYSLTFAKPGADGRQQFVLKGPDRLKVRGVTGTQVDLGAGGTVMAAEFDDPFFFDAVGFRRGFEFGEFSRNFFADFNTMAIVLEVPTASFGTLTNSTVGVWARTLKGKEAVDRAGRPAVATVLVAKARRHEFNAGSPQDDVAKWGSSFVATLKAPPFSRSDPDAAAITAFLLPDILTLKTNEATAFPNGRALSDDVIDVELALLTNGALSTDFVGSDSPFLDVFPYLAPRNP